MRKHTFAAAIILLLGLMLNSGIAHAQQLPNTKGMPLNISLSSTSVTVPVGSICSDGACTGAVQAGIEVCAYGGKGPYFIIVYNNNQQAASAATAGCYYYVFTPQLTGTYGIRFKVTDSSAPAAVATANATILAVPLNGGGPLSSSVSLAKADVNVSQNVAIGLAINGGVAPYSIKVYVNGNLSEVSKSYSPYSYSFTPSSVGAYFIRFNVSDGAGHKTNQTSTLYAVPSYSGGLAYGSNQLVVSVNPNFVTVQPGQPADITATASGGNTSGYVIFLYDPSGNIVAQAQGGTLRYTFTPYNAGQYYGFTAAAYDASGSLATEVAYVKTANVTPTNGTLDENITPQGQTILVGQKATFNITPSGGIGPYYLAIRDQNGSLVEFDVLNSKSPRQFSTKTELPGDYILSFTLSDLYGAVVSKSVTLQVAGTTINSMQHNYGTLNATIGQQVSVKVSPSVYPCPCTVLVYNNGAYQQSGTIPLGGAYNYVFIPTYAGTYSISFIVQYHGGSSDGYTETVLDKVHVSTQYIAAQNNLTVSISPSYLTYSPPGSTVEITATASGGNSAVYNIFLYDGSGNQLTMSQSDHLSYSYTVPYPAGTYYWLRVVVYDASHYSASNYTDIYAT